MYQSKVKTNDLKRIFFIYDLFQLKKIVAQYALYYLLKRFLDKKHYFISL